MDLLYRSTRDSSVRVTASQAVLKGLSADGGLFVPESIPKLDVSLDELAQMSYQETAYAVMSRFLTDFTEEELKGCIERAYDEKFDTPEIAPLVKAGGAYYLELFHGATIAFKDMALSILPHLMTVSAKKNQVKNEIVILTATSGDTGKAALAGFADVPGTRIVVFYPKNGVSPIQEKQMVTQKGANVKVIVETLTMLRAASRLCLATENWKRRWRRRASSFPLPIPSISDAWFRRLCIMYMHTRSFMRTVRLRRGNRLM